MSGFMPLGKHLKPVAAFKALGLKI
ncbi:hypothetical protein TRIP_B350156 [uncultured Desulfatiglans sp.]|uniref:Uncharacterized protein n=1 Tax=Uncultured Desulfatiglans sp. TaxID=1748965 RepID=A0A653AAL7_UNCDX|nr:hypothetical protein TRIP_B350156 [uncultured Desulfatiglans sp.]